MIYRSKIISDPAIEKRCGKTGIQRIKTKIELIGFHSGSIGINACGAYRYKAEQLYFVFPIAAHRRSTSEPRLYQKSITRNCETRTTVISAIG